MKNKNTIIIVAVILILLIGGGLYLGMKKSPAPMVQPNQEVKTPVAVNNSGNKVQDVEGTLKSLLTGGKNVTCTFSDNLKEVNISGTVYAANGKVRQDFESNTSAGKMTGHMIVQSPDAYMWTDQMNQGFKFSIEGQPTPSAASKNSQTPDINKSMKFSCQPWNPDNSLFTLPANITFQSMSVPAVPPTGGTAQTMPNGAGVSNQCGVCNSVPAGLGRDACKAQLKCP